MQVGEIREVRGQVKTKEQERLVLSELVWVIGYRLTAYIGRTTVETVAEWLQSDLPEELHERMQATLDVALPIAEMGMDNSERRLEFWFLRVRREPVWKSLDRWCEGCPLSHGGSEV
jgi:hypothetical protein